jgi:two-component system LytT family response regulator
LIKVKEHSKEYLLKKKLKELEKKLLQTQKELQRESEYNNHLEGILKESSAKKSTTITIKSATKIEFVQVNDIVCCNADEGYTDVQLMDGRVITAARPLTTFEKVLEEHSFFRISKSSLMNTNHIITFHKGRNQILLQGNILLNIARRRRVEFLKTLK